MSDRWNLWNLISLTRLRSNLMQFNIFKQQKGRKNPNFGLLRENLSVIKI